MQNLEFKTVETAGTVGMQRLLKSSLIVLVTLGSALLASSASAQTTSRVPATVQAYETAELYAKVGGYLKSVSVDIGDEVKAGQELAVLDAPEMEKQLLQKKSMLALAEAEVVQAKAKIDEASSQLEALQTGIVEAQSMKQQKQAMVDFEQTECQRIQGLVARGAIQQEKLAAASFKLKAAQADMGSVAAHVATAQAKLAGGKAAVRRAEADVVAAEAQIGVAQAGVDFTNQMIQYATIRAPWDGKVTMRKMDKGAFVQSAEGNSSAKPIFRLVRDDKVRVVFSVSQKDLSGLKKGAKVTLGSIDALPGESFEGTVARFAGELDPSTRMMRFEMDLDNKDGKLRPGYFGYATLHMEE